MQHCFNVSFSTVKFSYAELFFKIDKYNQVWFLFAQNIKFEDESNDEEKFLKTDEEFLPI